MKEWAASRPLLVTKQLCCVIRRGFSQPSKSLMLITMFTFSCSCFACTCSCRQETKDMRRSSGTSNRYRLKHATRIKEKSLSTSSCVCPTVKKFNVAVKNLPLATR